MTQRFDYARAIIVIPQEKYGPVLTSHVFAGALVEAFHFVD